MFLHDCDYLFHTYVMPQCQKKLWPGTLCPWLICLFVHTVPTAGTPVYSLLVNISAIVRSHLTILYILLVHWLLPPALPGDLRPLALPQGDVCDSYSHKDWPLIYSHLVPYSRNCYRPTARGVGWALWSHSLGRLALIPQRAAHGLPADKWADKASPHYSFPSSGRYQKEEKGAFWRGWIDLAARAIFSSVVMCSISLRWYNREKRAEKC